MPLHLEPLNVSDQLQICESVLIVSCPVCPPVSLATDRAAPFKNLLKNGIKTAAYEDFICETREALEQSGVRTGVFTSYMPCAAMCIWTQGQRNRLLKRAKGFEAALVMGCESARCTVQEVLKDTGCKTVLGMGLIGITNATLKFRFPSTITLEDPVRVTANEKVANLPSAGA